MRVSILWRLGISFLVLILFNLFLSYESISSMKSLQNETNKIYNHPFVFAKQSRDAHVYIQEVSILLSEAVRYKDIEDLVDKESKIFMTFKEIDKHHEILNKVLIGEKASFMAYLATYKKFEKSAKEVISLLKLGKNREAKNIYDKEYKKYQKRLLLNIVALKEHADEIAEDLTKKGEKNLQDTMEFFERLSIFIVILGFIFSYFSYIHYIRPISKFRQLIEDIARGDTSEKIYGLGKKDEMGDIARSISILNTNIQKITKHTDLIASGDYSADLITIKSNRNRLAQSIQIMTEKLRESFALNQKTVWMQDGIVKVAEVLRNDEDKELLGKRTLNTIASYTSAQVATLFVKEDAHLKLVNTYAYSKSDANNIVLKMGEGLVGEVALNGKITIIKSIPKDYINVSSSLGESVAKALVIVPFSFHGELRGVVELAYFNDVSDELVEFLESITESLAIAYENVTSREHLNASLAKEQSISEELQAQEEELRVSNNRLKEQSNTLQLQKKNLEITGKELSQKAIDLENASKYKSEFFTNMSHELRTPLNSLLILSRSLVDNDDKNLSDDELESAKIIQENGEHLLSLINDLLDISKAEAGHMLVNSDIVETNELMHEMNNRFVHMAKDKGIKFVSQVKESVPQTFKSDRKKLGQIITNLISNAIKFTHEGEVKLTIDRVDDKLCFYVKDTGIGIAKEKLEYIFEAFRQADGSTTRNYGGTGLGLSIARNFSQLLEGSVNVESLENVGTTFMLEIPYKEEDGSDMEVKKATFKETPPPFEDSRNEIDKNKSMFLIIEDDAKFAKILYDNCIEHESQAIVASDGETGVILARRYDIQGIILDYMLPGLDGSDILALLKSDEKTKHIPVHVMSALDNLMDMKQLGAVGQNVKPVSKEDIKNVLNKFDEKQAVDEVSLFRNHVKSTNNISSETLIGDKKINLDGKKILIVDDDMRNTFSLAKIFRAHKSEVLVAASGKKGVELLEANSDVDIVLMDIMMPEMDGYETIEKIRSIEDFKDVPIIAVTANAMKEDKEKCLSAGANDYMSKPIDIDKLFVMIQMFL